MKKRGENGREGQGEMEELLYSLIQCEVPSVELVFAEHVEEKRDVEEYRSGEPEQCDIGAVAAAVDSAHLLRVYVQCIVSKSIVTFQYIVLFCIPNQQSELHV